MTPPRPETSTSTATTAWMLRAGLSLLLGRADRARHLLARSAGALIALSWLAATWSLLIVAISILLRSGFTDIAVPEEDLDSEATILASLTLIGFGPILTATLAVVTLLILWRYTARGYARGRAQRVRRWRSFWAVVAIIAVCSIEPIAVTATGFDLDEGGVFSLRTEMLLWGGAIVLILLCTFSGIGALLAWALRRAFIEVGSLGILAAKALPLLIVTLLFCFYNAEIWQIASRLSWARTWVLIAVLVLLSALLVAIITWERVNDVRKQPLTTAEYREFLEGTPFAHCALAQSGQSAQASPHTPSFPMRARLNLIALPFFTQLIQIFWFILLVTAFLTFLGALSIQPVVVKAWTGMAPNDLHLLGAHLRQWREYVQVAMILAAFAGLSFAAGGSVESSYQRSFTAPLMREVRRYLAIQTAYQCDLRERCTPAPQNPAPQNPAPQNPSSPAHSTDSR